MLIVPLAGDAIKTAAGLPGKVIGFTNSTENGPSVILEDSTQVPFDEIQKLNAVPVKYVKNAHGYKVLETDGFVKRAYQLPQPGDSVRANSRINSGISDEGSREYEIVRVKLAVKDRESEGILFDVFQPGTEELIEEISLNSIEDIDHSIFNRSKFLKLYSEYSSKGQAGAPGAAGSTDLSPAETEAAAV
jgi:hypothetical protein